MASICAKLKMHDENENEDWSCVDVEEFDALLVCTPVARSSH